MKKAKVALSLLLAAVVAIAGLQVFGLVNAMPDYFPTNPYFAADPKTLVVPDEHSTIQHAIDSAAFGDTVYVKKGIYVENPIVNKSILLVGEDRDSTVIDVTAGLKITANGATVKGFTIYDGWQGISVSANCCNVEGNKITKTTHGIVVFGFENKVSGNILQSIGLSSAIQLNFAHKNLIIGNYIDSCVEGIQIWQYSINNTVTDNVITNCKDTAVNFQYSNDNMMNKNNISGSGLGTSIYGSNRNTITKNNYVNNTVQFGASESYYLTFGYNRSVNNVDGNYWSDYNGTDVGGDGIGDTPYIIDENNRDLHPITKPMAIANFSAPAPSDNAILDTTASSKSNPIVDPFLLILVIAAVAIVSASLLVYVKRCRHNHQKILKNAICSGVERQLLQRLYLSFLEYLDLHTSKSGPETLQTRHTQSSQSSL